MFLLPCKSSRAGAGERGTLDNIINVCKIAIMKTEPLPQPDDFVSLYRRAFREYGGRALWNVLELENPQPEDALAITRYLRVEGNLAARRLAEQIEKACHAAH